MTEPKEGEKKSRVEVLEDTVLQLIDKLADLEKGISKIEKTAVKKSTGLFGDKREKTATKDTTTGIVYVSKAAVGRALYGEIEGGNKDDHFAWYKLRAKFPERFVELDKDSAEAQKVWVAEKARQEAEVEEANKKLEAEKKAKEAAEKKTGK